MTPRHPHRPRWNPFRWVDEKAIGAALTKLITALIIAAVPAGAVAINDARVQAADRARHRAERAALVEQQSRQELAMKLRLDSLVVAVRKEKRRRIALERAVYHGRTPAEEYFGPLEPEHDEKPNAVSRAFGRIKRFFSGG